MREMLVLFLDLEPDLDICGTAPSAEQAINVLPGLACDLVLVDVSLPGMSGIDLVKQLKDTGYDQPLLMVSGHEDRLYVEESAKAGASGYVMKGFPEDILEAIDQVLDGRTYFGTGARKHLS